MGRYVFTPTIFDALERVKPGKGGELQLTDAMALLLADEEVYGAPLRRGPLRHRQQARLPEGHRRARPAPRTTSPPSLPGRGSSSDLDRCEQALLDG